MVAIPDAGIVARRIAAWFAREARVLPWRSDPTPYHVLLSELMLQQTRVETVLPYFARFVARWPDLEALAAAAEDDVLHEWAGLGYYSRARNLHRSAIAAAAAGGLPADPDALRALPGIGPYTAGAIASIAYGARAPLVDGNVERVLCRLDLRLGDPRKEERAGLWARARDLLDAAPEVHAGALNQGLMELGALVCTPRAPKCGQCPVAEVCRGREGDPEQLPRKAARAKPVEMRAVSVVATTPAGIVLGRRVPGLLGGLWEPLRVPVDGGAEVDALRAACRAWASVDLDALSYLGEVVHVFTHRRLTCAVYEAAARGAPALVENPFYSELRVLADPDEVALSALARRVLALRAHPSLPLAAEPAIRPRNGSPPRAG